MSGEQAAGKPGMSKDAWDMLYLVVCALHGEKPERERVAGMDLKKVRWFARFHALTAMCFMALEGTDAFDAESLSLEREWKEEKEKVLYKNVLMDAERKQILDEMEREGIWYLPLKGIILQNLYPRYGMRQMSDNDILYDAARQEDLVALMERRGYEAESVGKRHHDVFMKQPAYHFEMHTSLFSLGEGRDYYQNLRERLVQDNGKQYGYHMTDEDFYLYVMAHAYKHYVNSGAGLRNLIDSYVYIQKKGDRLDWAYIEREAGKLGMQAFEKQVRRLSLSLFSSVKDFDEFALADEEQKFLADYLKSGMYGTSESYMKRQMLGFRLEGEEPGLSDKLKYVWRRLVPDREWYEQEAPFFAKHRLLIPFFLVYRLGRHIVFQREWTKRELKILSGMGKKNENSEA